MTITRAIMHILLLTLAIHLLASTPPPVAAQNLPTSSATPPTVRVSDDGSCGNGLTCAGSLYGQCCSQHGFCGAGDAYCGEGCQAEFGFCGSLAPPGSGSGGVAPPPTATVTRTVTAFASGLFTTTVTLTGAITRTFLATSTTVVSRTEVRVGFALGRVGSWDKVLLMCS